MTQSAAPLERRQSIPVHVGNVQVGGGAPIVVQSMTNTDTADVAATVAQVRELAEAGSELVRVTVNTAEAAAAVPTIRERLDAAGCSVPLIGDFHFNGHRLLTEHPECARALAKFRVREGRAAKRLQSDGAAEVGVVAAEVVDGDDGRPFGQAIAAALKADFGLSPSAVKRTS